MIPTTKEAVIAGYTRCLADSPHIKQEPAELAVSMLTLVANASYPVDFLAHNPAMRAYAKSIGIKTSKEWRPFIKSLWTK